MNRGECWNVMHVMIVMYNVNQALLALRLNLTFCKP